MSRATPYKEQTVLPDRGFPINVFFVGPIPHHWHDHIEWIYVRQGTARIQVDASFETLSQGELVFVNSKQLHGTDWLSEDAKLLCIVFNEALVRGSGLDVTEHHYFLPYLHQRSEWPAVMRKDHPITGEIGEAFARLVEEFGRKAPGYELLVKAELLRIFGLYFRYAEQSARQNSSLIRQSNEFAALLHMIRDRYDQAISVKEAAEFVRLSPNHFCRVFKQLTGKTLVEYVHLLRINEAERLLLDTDWPVTEIAGRVGFPNLTYFGRVFKKLKSVSPSAVRTAAGMRGI
ncbi:helix-turn-helix domain-containing protein [Cohnella sp. CFH 77786]|uniref:AraC family transcriptional regulator n=1 Tax=Cohnella sp. CFH 77786 TaxID=2662265 RepID=UPI001C6106B0|nr:AraC family transcriptional regulator [Cohnella sp. CFH 77786]MBW5444627.1 helix-turn-helix domain-containing protein [Cohnella sp. CFH 77786]